MNDPSLVRSSLGLTFWLGALLLGGLLAGSVLELFSPVETPLAVVAEVLLIPLALLLAWLTLTWLSLRVYLYPDRLEARSLWGRRRLEWRHVARLRPAVQGSGLLPGGQYLIGLRSLKTGTLQLLWLLPFGNRRDLIQGVIDLSWRGNSSVRLDDSLTARYGYPPYGRKYHDEAEPKAGAQAQPEAQAEQS